MNTIWSMSICLPRIDPCRETKQEKHQSNAIKCSQHLANTTPQQSMNFYNGGEDSSRHGGIMCLGIELEEWGRGKFSVM